MNVRETIRPTNQPDIAAQENAATQTASVFGWWRKDLPLEASYRYWRDVHSIMVARIPGIYQYKLLHLEPNQADLWSKIDAIDFSLFDVDRPHGVAEMLFRTETDQKTFGSSSINTEFVFKDELNLCDRNATLSAVGNNAHTFVDRIGNPTPNGKPQFFSLMICFQQRESTTTEQFRDRLTDQIARPWSERSAVMRLRLHLLEPYSEKENSPYASHDWPQEKHYQAWMELAVEDEAILRSLLQEEHAQVIRAIHTFPIAAYYTLVSNNKLTEVGLRGFSAVQTIIEAGSEIQRQPDLLKALYGSAADR